MTIDHTRHSSRVTSIVLSHHHNVVVTLSDDLTAFFFKFGQTEGGTIVLEPAKCIRLPEKCLNLQWSPKLGKGSNAIFSVCIFW